MVKNQKVNRSEFWSNDDDRGKKNSSHMSVSLAIPEVLRSPSTEVRRLLNSKVSLERRQEQPLTNLRPVHVLANHNCLSPSLWGSHVGITVITSAKEVMFSVAFVCLSVCKITEKVMNGF